jgi:hypothetical protein
LNTNTVANGGFSISLILRAARLHFFTTHASLKQPHTISIQSNLLRQVLAGPVTIKLEDVKLGAAISNIHASLLNQRGETCIVAYLVQGNLKKNDGEGLNLDTGVLQTLPPLPPKSDTATMLRDEDPNWVFGTEWNDHRFAALRRNQQWYPRDGPAAPGYGDRWVRLSPGAGNWTDALMSYAADLPGTPVLLQPVKKYWVATVTLSLDFKKSWDLDDDAEGGESTKAKAGREWLLLRTTNMSVKDGKGDFNTVMVDEQGDVVALGTQVILLLPMERRKYMGEKKEKASKSKI